MNFCNMIDLGFSGPIFTWTNRGDVSDLIQQCLDRFWANQAWNLLFTEASVTHLPRISSNHCPLPFNLSNSYPSRLDRPFRFEKMWLSHPGFCRVVEDAWDCSPSLNLAISSFKTLASSWTREIFGNLFAKKRKIFARISGLEKALAIRPSAFLVSLEKELSFEYIGILNQEEDFWVLKSRIDWQILGDRNTAFFHIKTITRRKHNKIRCLQDNMGNWVDSEDQIIDIILNGFKKLYLTEHTSSMTPSDFDLNWAVFLTVEESLRLSVNVLEQEIHKAMFSLKPYKALGMDVLHAGFFQHFWSVLGQSVIEEIQATFHSKRIPNYLNQTLVVLIPKREGPETLSHF